MNVNPKKKKRLATVSEVADMPDYPFTKSALRHLIFQAEDRVASSGDIIPGNGLKQAGVLIRIGERVLIDLNKFDQWIENHRVGE